MKVKIGDKIFDAEKEPIMIVLTEEDKKNISNMHPEATKYVVYPDGTDIGLIRKFAEVEK